MPESEARAAVKKAEGELEVELLPWQKLYVVDFLQGFNPILMRGARGGKATLNKFLRHLHDTLHEH